MPCGERDGLWTKAKPLACNPASGFAVSDLPYSAADSRDLRQTKWVSGNSGTRKPAMSALGQFARRRPSAHVKAIYMSWKYRSGGPRGYHHGNLKEALLRAALELIAQKGPAGFTFAEAARWAGVSPAAPYRHFRDRDELLANLALRGFERFAIVLEQAWDNGRPQPFIAL